IQSIAGYVLAAAGLIWVLHDVHPSELVARFTIRDWRWMAAVVVADTLAYLAQGWRWSLLLLPLGKLRPVRVTQAVYSGLFANEVLPLHAGELFRAYVVSRWLQKRFIAVIPSIAVERLLDGLWLALAIGTVAIFVPLPRGIERGADIFGITIVVCAAGFAYLVYWKSAHEPAPRLRFLTPVAVSFRQIAST